MIRISASSKRTLSFALFTLALGALVGGVAVLAQYRSTLNREEGYLSHLVENNASFIQVVARADARFSQMELEGGAFSATLSQVAEAHRAFQGFDATGALVLGERVGDSIVFHSVTGSQAALAPRALPYGAVLAAPMRAALEGRTGSLQGEDFRGITVLASFAPLVVQGRRLGLVAKKDLAEIQAPVLRTLRLVGLSVVLLTAVLALLFHFLGLPLLRRLRDTEIALRDAESSLGEAEAELEEAEAELVEAEAELVDHRTRLSEAERRFRATFEQAAVGIAQVSTEGRFMRFNGKMAEIIGYSPDEATDLLFQEIVHPEDLEKDMELLRRVLAGEIETLTLELRCVRKNQSVTWVLLTASLVEAEGGAPNYFIFIVQDISDQKMAEEELERAMAQLERSNRELQQFAYVASHDLQEPLRMVASFTQLLADRYRGKLDSDADEFIGFAVDGANRMQALIQGLLRYSRVETKGGDFVSTDVAALLGTTVEDFRAVIEETGAEIVWGDLPTIVADSDQIRRVFMNLIQNALKFGPERGAKIQIGSERRSGEWLFSVQDNGPGIEPAYFERIFQIYQRLGPRDENTGTGIGLSLCQRIVQRHGGNIWVESEPGHGATFFFTIPDRSLAA